MWNSMEEEFLREFLTVAVELDCWSEIRGSHEGSGLTEGSYQFGPGWNNLMHIGWSDTTLRDNTMHFHHITKISSETYCRKFTKLDQKNNSLYTLQPNWTYTFTVSSLDSLASSASHSHKSAQIIDRKPNLPALTICRPSKQFVLVQCYMDRSYTHSDVYTEHREDECYPAIIKASHWPNAEVKEKSRSCESAALKWLQNLQPSGGGASLSKAYSHVTALL